MKAAPFAPDTAPVSATVSVTDPLTAVPDPKEAPARATVVVSEMRPRLSWFWAGEPRPVKVTDGLGGASTVAPAVEPRTVVMPARLSGAPRPAPLRRPFTRSATAGAVVSPVRSRVLAVGP